MVSQQVLGFPPKLGEGYRKAVGGKEKGTYQSGARCFLDGLTATRTSPRQASLITRPWLTHNWNVPVLASGQSGATGAHPLPNSELHPFFHAEPTIPAWGAGHTPPPPVTVNGAGDGLIPFGGMNILIHK